MVVENEVEMGGVGQDTSNEEPGTRSQLTGSLSNVVYTPSRVSVCGKGPDDTSNTGGLEFEVEDKILGLLTEAADKIDIKAIK